MAYTVPDGSAWWWTRLNEKTWQGIDEFKDRLVAYQAHSSSSPHEENFYFMGNTIRLPDTKDVAFAVVFHTKGWPSHPETTYDLRAFISPESFPNVKRVDQEQLAKYHTILMVREPTFQEKEKLRALCKAGLVVIEGYAALDWEKYFVDALY